MASYLAELHDQGRAPASVSTEVAAACFRARPASRARRGNGRARVLAGSRRTAGAIETGGDRSGRRSWPPASPPATSRRRRVGEGRPRARPPRRRDHGAPLHGRDAGERGQRRRRRPPDPDLQAAATPAGGPRRAAVGIRAGWLTERGLSDPGASPRRTARGPRPTESLPRRGFTLVHTAAAGAPAPCRCAHVVDANAQGPSGRRAVRSTRKPSRAHGLSHPRRSGLRRRLVDQLAGRERPGPDRNRLRGTW